MELRNYFYVKPDTLSEDGKSNRIAATLDKRTRYMSDVFYGLYKNEIHNKIQPKGKTAFLYVLGGADQHSHSRDFSKVCNIQPGSAPILSQSGYIASKLASRFDNVEYVSLNANTCASSMYALYEAERLLKEGFNDIIIYAEEWVEEVELYFFNSLGISIVCSDGFAVLHLDNGPKGLATITNTKWIWNKDKSAFGISKEGYIKALKDQVRDVEIIKKHGTGTDANESAEDAAIDELYRNDMLRISIKEEIGHSQGVSTALELCIMLSEHKYNNFICSASGLGGFYGSCHVSR